MSNENSSSEAGGLILDTEPIETLEPIPEKETVRELKGVEAVLKYYALRAIQAEWNLPPLLATYLIEHSETRLVSVDKVMGQAGSEGEEYSMIKIRDPKSSEVLSAVFIKWNQSMEPEIIINDHFNPNVARAGMFIESMNITAPPEVIQKLEGAYDANGIAEEELDRLGPQEFADKYVRHSSGDEIQT